ncbi:hypothetical protein [Alkaliphilus sp. B6464]|nr:hypothetical protein [Alkaliphilus sp. B6464]QUH18787.1 hypothetical protein HYG84_01915 [Alkaliphilus sp. B6464]
MEFIVKPMQVDDGGGSCGYCGKTNVCSCNSSSYTCSCKAASKTCYVHF